MMDGLITRIIIHPVHFPKGQNSIVSRRDYSIPGSSTLHAWYILACAGMVHRCSLGPEFYNLTVLFLF